MLPQEEEDMSSPLNVINQQITSAERLALKMGKQLQAIAGEDVRNKLESGEIRLINGRYTGESLKVPRPARRRF